MTSVGDLMPSGAQAAVCELTLIPGVDGKGSEVSYELLVSAQTVTCRNFPGFGNGNWLFCHTDTGSQRNAGLATFGGPPACRTPVQRNRTAAGSEGSGSGLGAGGVPARCVRTCSTEDQGSFVVVSQIAYDLHSCSLSFLIHLRWSSQASGHKRQGEQDATLPGQSVGAVDVPLATHNRGCSASQSTVCCQPCCRRFIRLSTAWNQEPTRTRSTSDSPESDIFLKT